MLTADGRFYPLLLILFQVQELKVMVVVELVIKYPYIFVLINKRVKRKSRVKKKNASRRYIHPRFTVLFIQKPPYLSEVHFLNRFLYLKPHL